jgi:glycosyltransferase involved in cell wall biosynthesis
MTTTSGPTVGVVVATNRHGPFLAEALASVAAQTYPAIDLVVVDDGSPEPEAVRRTAQAAGARCLRLEPSGVSAARNAGVDLVDGELLVFLDDDDRWHPERIARQVDALLARPEAVLSYCGMRTIDVVGRELAPADQRQLADEHEVLRRRTGIVAPNIMVRRSAFDGVGRFDRAVRYGEDLDLVLRLALAGPFVFVPGALVDYRAHASNVTRDYRRLALGVGAVLHAHRDSAAAAGRDDLVADLRESLDAHARWIAWSCLRSVRREVAERRWRAAAGDLAWTAAHAPTAPAAWVRGRLARARASRADRGTP